MSSKPPACASGNGYLRLDGVGRVGGARRDRTDDLKLAKLALSQLSYGPFSTSRLSPCGDLSPGIRPFEGRLRHRVVGLERFELSTSRLSSARSNQLSYRPGKRGGRPNEGRETKAAVSRKVGPEAGASSVPCVSKSRERANPRGVQTSCFPTSLERR